MKRTAWILTLIIAAVLLSACGATPTATPTPTPTAAPTPASDGSAGAETPACQVAVLFQEQPEAAKLLPPITDQDWKLGPDGAYLTLIEYSDFQCPYCQQTSQGIKDFVAAHAGEVQLVYRHFPLPGHDKSTLSAQAAEAAGLQGKFWEMHALLFDAANWTAWIEMSLEDFSSWVIGQAETIEGLDVEKFKTDLTSDAIVKKATDAYATATELQIPGTPSLYVLIDGKLYFTPLDQVSADSATLELVYELSKFKDRQFDACPPTVIDANKHYTATLETSKGKIVIELFPDKAPLAVNSFVFLAREGWFDNAPWHRVLEGFVAQSGDPSGTGVFGPGYLFKNESSDLKFDQAGLVGMANSGADRNGSQFFITLDATPNLDGGYTIFGRVIEGMDVVQSLTVRDPQSGGVLPEPDTILSVTIEEK